MSNYNMYNIDVGAFYTHYARHTIYKVLGVGTYKTTFADVVVYQSVDDHKVWVRPATEFFTPCYPPCTKPVSERTYYDLVLAGTQYPEGLLVSKPPIPPAELAKLGLPPELESLLNAPSKRRQFYEELKKIRDSRIVPRFAKISSSDPTYPADLFMFRGHLPDRTCKDLLAEVISVMEDEVSLNGGRSELVNKLPDNVLEGLNRILTFLDSLRVLI